MSVVQSRQKNQKHMGSGSSTQPAGASGSWILRERTKPTCAIVEGDGGVEATLAVELHERQGCVDPGGKCGDKTVDRGHRFPPADEQRQPLSVRGVSPTTVGGSRKAEDACGFADAVGRVLLQSRG